MSEETTIAAPRRVLSGMRPTGRLHLGNYVGALKNWVELQNEVLEDGTPKYECYFFIADFHALTTDYADTSRLQENTMDVALDFLAAGLDPDKCTIFVQSHVPQHAELYLLLSMITPLSWLERVPSYKDQQEQLKERDLATLGFLGYPLLQSADILVYQAHFVPVGQDQAAHVEITREVARRFTFLYPKDRSLYRPVSMIKGDRYTNQSESPQLLQVPQVVDGEGIVKSLDDPRQAEDGDVILPEPDVLLTPSPKLPGIDGRKMSKSYGNTISLTDQASVVRMKMELMTNGGQRVLQSEPGDPDACPVGDIHRLFSSEDVNLHIQIGCRTASIGCLQCKQLAGDSISRELKPIQEKRSRLEANPGWVNGVLENGAQRAALRAEQTMLEVRKAVNLARDLSGAKIESSLDRGFRAAGLPPVHNLEALKGYWDNDELRPGILRSYWLDKIVPRDIVLKRDSERVFITSTKKRVYVTTSREARSDAWNFRAKPKSYEMLVLLCWDRSYLLYDFVVPQKVYVEAWSRLKKQDKSSEIQFSVSRSEGAFRFELDGESTDITEFRGDYAPMR